MKENKKAIIPQFKYLNPHFEELKIEKFKMLTGKNDLSEDEITNMIASIETLAAILYEIVRQDEAISFNTAKENIDLKQAA